MGGMRGWALVLALVAGVAQAGPSVERLDAGAFPRVSVKLAIAGATAGSQPTVGDLAVKEDGQPVADLQLGTDSEPIWISMVVDQSGSMQPAIADLKKAAKTFVDEAPSGFRMELVLFGNEVQRKVSWSPARGELNTAIDRIEPYGATALMDALQDGILSLDKVKDGRHVLVAFTDGRDQNAAGTAPQSRATAKQVVAEAKRAGVPLYLIGLGAEVNKPLMQKMAAITGGRFFHAPDRGELSRIYREVALLLRASFELTYTTPKPATDGSVRTVEVTSNWAPSAGVATARYRAPSAAAAAPKGVARDRIAVAYTLPRVSENAEAAVLHSLEMKLNASSKTAVNSAITALTAAETAAAAGGTALVLGRANALAAEKAVRDAWLAEDAILAAELARVSTAAARAGRAAVLAERAAFLAVWAPWRLTVYRSLGFATAAVDEASRAVDRARQASAAAHLATDAGLKSASDALLAATEASIIAAEGAAVGAAAAHAATDAARVGLNAAHTGLNAGAAGLEAGRAGLEAGNAALEAGNAAAAAGAEATRAAEDAAAAAELGAEHAGDALDNAGRALDNAGQALDHAGDALEQARERLQGRNR